MFGFSGGEFLIVAAVAALVVGPRDIARAVQWVRRTVTQLRARSARLRESSEVDLSALGVDLSGLPALAASLGAADPRAMIQEAVREEVQAWLAATQGGQEGQTVQAGQAGQTVQAGEAGSGTRSGKAGESPSSPRRIDDEGGPGPRADPETVRSDHATRTAGSGLAASAPAASASGAPGDPDSQEQRS